jgi:hypothetical protein
MASRFGRMARDMRVNGRTTRLMAKAHSGMFMVISMWETGLMIRHKDLVYILIQTGQVTLVNGRTTFSMATESKNGWTGRTTKVTTFKEESKVKVLIYGLMVLSTLETGLRIK